MRVRRRISSLLLVTAGASGCLPSRDNPQDSTNAPVALLEVVDATLDDGSCPTSLPARPAGPTTVSSSRGRCLALDARGSTDPKQRTLTRTILLVSTNGGATALEMPIPQTEGFDPAAGFVPLPPLFRRERPVFDPEAGDAVGELVFRLDVRNSIGGHSRTEQRLRLENSPPVAFASPSRSLPLGGHRYALGDDFEVHFSSPAGNDADEDPLTYHWSFPATATEPAVVVESTNRSDLIFVRHLASESASRFTALHWVDDGLRSSPVVAVPVNVQPANILLESEFGLELIDSLRKSFPDPPSGLFLRGAIYEGAKTRVVTAHAVSYSTIEVGLRAWPGATLLSPAQTFGGDYLFDASVAADPERNRVLVSSENDYDSRLLSYSVTGDSDTLTPGFSVDLATNFTYLPARIVIDGLGDAWVHRSPGSATLERVTTAGVRIDMPVPDDRLITGVAVRPVSGEVWVLETPDFLDAGVGVAAARLLVYPPGSTTPSAEYALGWDQVFGITFASEESFWLAVEGQGLVLVGVDDLDVAQVDAEAAIRTRVPDLFEVFDLVIDAATGDAWTARAGFPIAYRISTDGAVEEFATGEAIVPFAVDAFGTLWYQSASRLLNCARAPSFDGVRVRHFGTYLQSLNAVDPGTGGFWVANAIPAGLSLLAEDGTELERITRIVIDDLEQPFPRLGSFNLAHDGKSAWGIEMVPNGSLLQENGVFEFDLTVRPPVASKILDLQDMQNAGILLPAAAGSTFPLWTARVVNLGMGFNYQIAKISLPVALEPVFEPIHDFSEGDAATGMDASPVSNRLCVASLDRNVSLPFEANLRQMSPDGTVTLLRAATSSSNFFRVTSVASLVDETRDTCWYAYGDYNAIGYPGSLATANSTIEGWQYVGSPSPVHPPIVESGGVVTSIGGGPDVLWLTKLRLNPVSGQPETTLVRHEWNPLTGTFLRTETGPFQADTELVTPAERVY